MTELRLVILLVAVILVSGCVEDIDDIGGFDIGGGEEVTDLGLVIEDFYITDEQLNPGQEALITVNLQNFHTEYLEINEISLFNTGNYIDNLGRECNPEPEELDLRDSELVPEMECSWTVRANEIEDFDSRSIPLMLDLEYTAEFTPAESIEATFRDLEDIQQTDREQQTFSNEEIAMTYTIDQPIAFGQNQSINLEVRATGNGQVSGEDAYEFSYSPEQIFRDCPSEKTPLTGSEVEFSCGVQMGDSQQRVVTQDLFISTVYNYNKQRELPVQIVSN